ncbi:MAG: class I SAM-dependent methyltransferase [Candidatus Curtissbacteria bacterium]|nr:class I SAM-dependent methyltransferase [Candidatus Curtissbacteria bacterium]
MKNLVFKVFQARRDKWLKKYLIKGRILEIGSGEGNFANALKGNYEITCIEHPGAKINNRKVLKVDFLKWKTHKKFDGVFFWESLEHVPTPVEYLKKSFNLLTDNGFLFIELPRFDCLESRIFKKHWFHLDPPRHLVHITSSGLDGLFSRSGFMKIEKKDVFAVEYVLWGFLESFLDIIGIKSTDYFKKSKFPFFLLFLFPILAFATVAELFFFLIKESPINFVVARKRNG